MKVQAEHVRSYSRTVPVQSFVPKKLLNVVTDEKVTKQETIEYTDEDDIRSQQTLQKLPKGEVRHFYSFLSLSIFIFLFSIQAFSHA
jgi:hypothetical protein